MNIKNTEQMKVIKLMFIVAILHACNLPQPTNNSEKWKSEIANTEKQFMEMAAKEGLAKAFTFYAADSAVINRGNSIIKGKAAISKIYNKPSVQTNIKLIWEPDFIDVSAAGDLAYTYGQYTYSYTDTTGTEHSTTGYFHTVWKRQANGSWKYVYD